MGRGYCDSRGLRRFEGKIGEEGVRVSFTGGRVRSFER